MGFFHEGHLSLMEAARGMADTVIVSLFVNPLQFNAKDDLAGYPRDFDRDGVLAERAEVDVVFAPSMPDMFPVTPVTRARVGRLGDRLEGEHRPGHFEGVATVVAKLFAGLQPDLAFFGRKDAQQLAVVRRMATDLSFPVEIVACPTVRETDGLALSSRNVLLSAEERERATGLYQGLAAAAEAIARGERTASALEAIVRGEAPHVVFDYVELASSSDVEQMRELDRPSFLAVAAHLGSVRLIDNVGLDPVDGRWKVDSGVFLDKPSLVYGGGW
jgi:pantoate--beta-alanine ligase